MNGSQKLIQSQVNVIFHLQIFFNGRQYTGVVSDEDNLKVAFTNKICATDLATTKTVTDLLMGGTSGATWNP